MDFGEKLQQLRKSRGLTQEELAQALYVSRAAVSKWESGRGYPSIDYLKQISHYFSVSIDDMLSGEKLLLIAEKENRSNIRGLCDLVSGIVDIFSLLLIVLPLYSRAADGYVLSVNLLSYGGSVFNRAACWVLFCLMIATGVARLVLTKSGRGSGTLSAISVGLNVVAVVFLALTREPYAVIVSFLMLMTKGAMLLKAKS
ncbi:MAG: helix-turn-helix transcriptional regulator [Clostridia bacterium]|nr:helix-turn-helix transcriptional regulator [Clostridia bacterium]